MHRHIIRTCGSSLRPLNIRVRTSRLAPNYVPFRALRTRSDFESKYAEKLRERAEEKGLSVEELKAKAKEEQAIEARRRREALAAEQAARAAKKHASTAPQAPSAPVTGARTDSSPVKPLSTILNLNKIMATPHDAAKIGALWTAYHVSRSGGTGRGYVCASVPLDLYNKMASAGERYPTFVVPIPRIRLSTEPKVEGEEDTAYEFYFLQWNFHDVPPVPSATEDLFSPAKPTAFSAGVNPRTSTILFTPLQEYKMRAAFATPYLVLTHYTDLAHSHGVVLLRGEITPASAGGGTGVDGRYMMSQEDAQLLSMAVQRFYLWGGEGQEGEGARLLKCFHEAPEEFKWEDLLKHASLTI
ncbi:Protein ATP11, mitochondrial [Hypsizygus marmoreus]|uniref:Protein ATP11, mitochondrial n=1 Tax=Hypsizygus marmoreus TaxID=39966 RepID=A0A369KB66_HYPMA|nr:Protein ATP11, mitochondrial [Hypsizygus marmoreus]